LCLRQTQCADQREKRGQPLEVFHRYSLRGFYVSSSRSQHDLYISQLIDLTNLESNSKLIS
jgi:hypothetical protein